MFLGHRNNDAVITICQDNTRQAVEIVDLNPSASQMLGYEGKDLRQLPLKALLPDRIQELVHEYVEFNDSGTHDIAAVLGKVQHFSILTKEGRELVCQHKLVRAESFGPVSNYKLVLQDRSGNRQQNAFRSVLKENFKGHEVLDPETGLPDRASLYKDLELVLFHANKGDIQGCFAILEIDAYDSLLAQQGAESCKHVLKHVASLARQNLRSDDTIGVVSYKRVGLILTDTVPDSARMVLNRLRWLINSNPLTVPTGKSQATTVSISFAKIGGRVNDKNLLSDCEQFLDSLSGRGGNLLIEVGEMDKRSKQDRRQRSVPVAFDRRGDDRRKE